MFYLYKITNILNDKVYIGQSNNYRRRWNAHRAYAKNPKITNQYIHRAIAKHEICNFIFEVIAMSKTIKDANYSEKILIIQYDSIKCGYNIDPGGNSINHSIGTIEKIRLAFIKRIKAGKHPALGTKRTTEQLNTLSKARKDHPVVYTDEIRQRMSESHIGNTDSEITKQKKSEKAKIAWEARICYDGIKCNAPGCSIEGKHKYKIINNIRYCNMHGLRMLRNNTLEKLPTFKYTIDNPMPEEVRIKCGNGSRGKVAYNRIQFSKEQIDNILSDTRSIKKISKEYGVTEKVIKRVKDGIF